MVSLTLTSCKRPDLFIETILSLQKSCPEIDKHIYQVVWSDDHSSFSDYALMKEILLTVFPTGKIKSQNRTDGSRGLSHSLNWILDNIETDLCFHCEDDWRFIKHGNFIEQASSIIQEFPTIKQVLLKERDMFNRYEDSNGVPFTVWERGQALDGQIVEHCGFTLNPSIVDFGFYRDEYGKFNNFNVEGSWCERAYADGIRTACLADTYIEHIGLAESSFSLNGTPR